MVKNKGRVGEEKNHRAQYYSRSMCTQGQWPDYYLCIPVYFVYEFNKINKYLNKNEYSFTSRA